MSPYERGGGVTPTEQRGAHSVADLTGTPTTPRGGKRAETGVKSISSRASRVPEEKFTALMHHFTEANLRAAYGGHVGFAAAGAKAPDPDDADPTDAYLGRIRPSARLFS